MTILLASFGNLMGMDGLMIFTVLLLFFGAKKLPELARGLGQSLNEFKKAREDIEGEFKAGQQDLQPRAGVPAAVPTQALTYNAPVAAGPSTSEIALQQQIAELQQRLQAMEAKKQEVPTSTL